MVFQHRGGRRGRRGGRVGRGGRQGDVNTLSCDICGRSGHGSESCWQNPANSKKRRGNHHGNNNSEGISRGNHNGGNPTGNGNANGNRNKNNTNGNNESKSTNPNDNKHNQRGRNGYQNNNNQNLPCFRCGLRGHDEMRCSAAPRPADQQCPCGCEFHAPWQCPWQQDFDVRDNARARSTGIICQWCKGHGDGRHVLADCTRYKDFLRDAREHVQQQYEHMYWCVFCRSSEHKTRACQTPAADMERRAWWHLIDVVARDWIHHSMSDQYLNGLEGDPGSVLVAPVARELKWCIYCSEFNHQSNRHRCDTTRIDLSAPPEYQISRHRRSDERGENASRRISYMQIDDASLTRRRSSERLQIPLSVLLNLSRARGFDEADLAAYISQVITKQKNDKKKYKVQKNNKYRPSVEMPARFILQGLWPEHQPRYEDGGELNVGGEPIYNRNAVGDVVYNELGNHNLYLPATRFRVTQEQLMIANDDTRPINRVGRKGLQLCCFTCRSSAFVRDEEGDLVMCGVDAACTLGCGEGRVQWDMFYGRGDCSCVPAAGQVRELRWVYPDEMPFEREYDRWNNLIRRYC